MTVRILPVVIPFTLSEFAERTFALTLDVKSAFPDTLQ